MSGSKTNLIKGGYKALGDFLANERSRFARSPVLLLECCHPSKSKNVETLSSTSQPETLAGRQLHLILAQQLGINTIVAKAPSSVATSGKTVSHFPTRQWLDQQLELVQRVGAGTVVGVGHGLDLAKAMARARNNHQLPLIEELILVPNTYEAVLSSGFPQHSLFWHDTEHVLLPGPPMTMEEKQNGKMDESFSCSTTVACLDVDAFEDGCKSLQTDQDTALFACLGVLLEALQRCDPTDPKIKQAESLLQNYIETVVSKNDELMAYLKEEDSSASKSPSVVEQRHEAVFKLLYETGHDFLEFGLSSDRKQSLKKSAKRSSVLAVAVSLLPSVFPEQDLLQIMAAISATLAKEHEMRLPQQPASLLAPSNETVDTLLQQHVRPNQLNWNCQDASEKEIKSLLEAFTLLPSATTTATTTKNT